MLEELGLAGIIGAVGRGCILQIIGIESAHGRRRPADCCFFIEIRGRGGKGGGDRAIAVAIVSLIDVRTEAIGIGGGSLHVLRAERVLHIHTIKGGITSLHLGVKGIFGNGTTGQIPTAPHGTHHIVWILESIGLKTLGPAGIDLAILNGSTKTDHLFIRNDLFFVATKNNIEDE